MTNTNETSARCDGCDCFRYGDVVEHRMNTNVFGVVVGFMGSLVGIQVSPSLDVLWFHEWTLRLLDDDDEYEPPAAQEADNVVNIADYKLTAASKTRGAA